MHRMKKSILPLLLAVLMALSTVVSASAAAKSPAPKALKKVTVAKVTVGYNGKNQKPTITVYDKNGKKVSSKNYTVTWKNNKKIGTATVIVKGKGSYTGKVSTTFKIVKGTQSKLWVGLKKTNRKKARPAVGMSRKTVKRKNRYLGYITYNHHHGKVKYKSNYKKIRVSKKGKVYVLKGAKKGWYKIKMTCYKARKYKNASKYVVIHIK